jgi:hypothetical protein
MTTVLLFCARVTMMLGWRGFRPGNKQKEKNARGKGRGLHGRKEIGLLVKARDDFSFPPFFSIFYLFLFFLFCCLSQISKL